MRWLRKEIFYFIKKNFNGINNLSSIFEEIHLSHTREIINEHNKILEHNFICADAIEYMLPKLTRLTLKLTKRRRD